MRHARYYGAVTGFAGVLTLAALSSSIGAPISTGAVALKSATSGASSDVIDVRWRGRRWGYYGGGFATGLAIGALAARPYYYEPYYYGPPPAYYAPPPAYYAPPAAAYVDPNGPVRQCWIATDRDRGFGYYRPC